MADRHYNLYRGQSSTENNSKIFVQTRKEFRTDHPMTFKHKRLLDDLLTTFDYRNKFMFIHNLKNLAEIFKDLYQEDKGKKPLHNLYQENKGEKPLHNLYQENSLHNLYQKDDESIKILTQQQKNKFLEDLQGSFSEDILERISDQAKERCASEYTKILKKVLVPGFSLAGFARVKGLGFWHCQFSCTEPLREFNNDIRNLFDWGFINFLILNRGTRRDFLPKILDEVITRIFSKREIYRILVQIHSILPEWIPQDEAALNYMYAPAKHIITLYPEQYQQVSSSGYIPIEAYVDVIQDDELIHQLLEERNIAGELAYHRAISLQKVKEKINQNKSLFRKYELIQSNKFYFIFLAEWKWSSFCKELEKITIDDLEMTTACQWYIDHFNGQDNHENVDGDDSDFINVLDEEGYHNLMNSLEG